MNEITSVQWGGSLLVCIAIVALQIYLKRLRRKHRAAYNDYVLRRRDNVPMGDLDVDSGDGI